VDYGHSDVGKAVSWLLNDDTKAADVMTAGKEFHSLMVRGAEGFLK